MWSNYEKCSALPKKNENEEKLEELHFRGMLLENGNLVKRIRELRNIKYIKLFLVI